jgi:hypothetical protein
MNPMVYCVATRGWEKWMECMGSWWNTASQEYRTFVCMGKDVVPALQCCYEETEEPILAFIQDDVIIYEQNWDLRVLKEFDDSTVGMVSFGGGIGHCRPELHHVPFRIPNLARQDFISNMREAEIHGSRFRGERDIAVVDGFAVFIRRSILDTWGGFPRGEGVHVGYFMVWENACCEVRRQGFRIRVVGVDCHHIGGRTSAMHTTEDRQKQYQSEHVYFFEHNKDMIPWRAPE